MTLWTVWYESWQMECCGTPFAVGDEVALPLMITPREQVGDAAEWEEWFSVVEGPVRHERGFPVVRGAGGLDAALHGSLRTPPERIALTGLLSVELHTGKWPRAVGRVTAVRILSRGYAPVAPGSTTYSPVPGKRWLRDADTCPKWFSDESRERRDDGALVTLAVPGDRPAPERGQ
ncbi:DUF6578 domain-containing protein [Streptomyces sp. NPDC052225]|uniref:DUF6578 domain-containing protein n=1 Tax=Streptomyces sp. NPDC052225 TaxID=3154949 RepID=UPI0034209142